MYAVSALASATVAAAAAAVSALQAVRTGAGLRPVTVDRLHAAAAFRSERYTSAVGWTLPSVWDPIAGDYRTRDGSIRFTRTIARTARRRFGCCDRTHHATPSPVP